MKWLVIIEILLISLMSCASPPASRHGGRVATETTTQPAASGLPQPDRVIVHDFGVTGGADERRQGQALAGAVTGMLVETLRAHGVNAVHVSATPLPGPTTASILGEVTRAAVTGETRVRVQVYQGAGSAARLVSEMETSTAGGAGPSTVEADARRTADAVAGRLGQYYRRQGWAWR